MSENKIKTINKKCKKTIRFNSKAVEHILKFIDSRYGEYAVEVNLSSDGRKEFNNLNTAVAFADENENYLVSITIIAQKDTENFNIKFVNPENKSEATASLACSSEGRGLYNIEYFFDDLIKIMSQSNSVMSSSAFRLSVFAALIVNIYMSLNYYLNDVFLLPAYFIPIGILAVGYLAGIIGLLTKNEVPKIELYIDAEKINQKNQGQEWKRQAGAILFFVLFAAAAVIQLLIRMRL